MINCAIWNSPVSTLLAFTRLATGNVTRCWNKRSPNFTMSYIRSHRSFHFKGIVFKVAQKVTCIWEHEWKICHQKLSKIVQSGHTGHRSKTLEDSFSSWTSCYKLTLSLGSFLCWRKCVNSFPIYFWTSLFPYDLLLDYAS